MSRLFQDDVFFYLPARLLGELDISRLICVRVDHLARQRVHHLERGGRAYRLDAQGELVQVNFQGFRVCFRQDKARRARWHQQPYPQRRERQRGQSDDFLLVIKSEHHG